MIGMAKPAEWLETDWIPGHFGRQRKTAVTKFIEFVREGKGLESVWDNKNHPMILGDEVYIESIFKEHVGDCTADVKEINRLERKPTSESIDYYFKSECSKRDSIIEAYKSGGFTLKAIADHRERREREQGVVL